MNKLKQAYTYLRDKARRYGTYIKILISAIILYLVFTKVDPSAVWNVFSSIPFPTLLIVLTITLSKFITQAVCWQFCLNITGASEHGSLRKTLRTHSIGLALRFLLPGGYATFGKVFYYDPNKKKETFYAVVIEKFYLIWIVWFMAVWAFICLKKIPSIPLGVTEQWLVLTIILAFLISILPFTLVLLFRKYIPYEILERYFITLPFLILVQVGYITLTCIQYYVVLQAVTPNHINFLQIALTIPLVLVANTIPITFSGLGLRETAAVVILTRLGIEPEFAVGASLIDFTLNAVIPAIPGAIYIITHKRVTGDGS